MAGHSQFKNIMYRKGAQDAKRAKIFTKIIRELTVSAKTGGGDPESNPRLRAAIISARASNMAKDTMERAIKRGVGGEDTADYLEIRYEGYGPGGIALIVETLTDNRNRTAPEIRTAFNKYGGALGESNSVSYLFDHAGLVRYPENSAEADTLFEVALEAGAQDIQNAGGFFEIISSLEDFAVVRDALVGRFGDPASAQLAWIPKTILSINEATAETLLKLVDVLEDNDDVQHVWGNYEIPEEILEKWAK